MISFDLRVAGRRDEAERLVELLWMLVEGAGAGPGELDSVLELLFQLAGSVPPPASSFSRDYARRKRTVMRRPPLGGYVSEELPRLEARTWALMTPGPRGTLRGEEQVRKGDQDVPVWSPAAQPHFGPGHPARTCLQSPNNAEVTGLAILVPPCFDQSEDEGFQSASNLTHDSQSEPSPSPSWTCGRPCGPSYPVTPQLLERTQLVGDLLNVLIGVASATFPLNQACVQFEYGTHYLRLSCFSLQSAQRRGLVFQAFTGGLRRYLQYYRACVLSTPHTFSLLTIFFLFRKLGRQLRYLSELCCVDGASAGGQATFPVGVKLLSYLFNEAQSNCSNENYPVLLSLLKSSCEPYTRFVYDWVYSGVFRDVYGEFMIQVNEDYLSFRDKHFWSQGYTLISRDVEECVPVFLRHMANDVYVCGKTINLLKICCPQHYICWSELPVPRIAVTFSLQEVEEIERDCAVYRGRMGRIAKQSAISREEQAQRTERARQELISQVRASTNKTLESIRGLQVSQRLAEEAKKRERFDELRQQLEQEQEWRSAAQRKEQDNEFGFVREMQDREKRLQALEEQLELRARKELIAQYSRLSEEAARRESRAMWRVQRMRLDQDRAQFLQEDLQLTQALLERYPLGQQGPPPDPLPTSTSTQRPSQVSTDPGGEVQDTPPGPQDTPTSPKAPPSPAGDYELDVRDFLPKPPHALCSQEVDRALQDIGSDLLESASLPPSQDYDFSAPYIPLQEGSARPNWGPAVLPLVRIQASEAQGQVQTYGPQSRGAPPCLAPGPEQPPQESPRQMAAVQPTRQEGESDTSESVENARTVGARQGGASAADAQAIGSQPEKLPHPSHASTREDNFAPEAVNPVPDPSIVLPTTQAHVTVGDFVLTVELPSTSPTAHSHASDAHLTVGEHVSEVMAPVPTPSIHGHASDAHIRVGEHVSEVMAPVPTPSIHGHASNAHIRVGEHVSEVMAPVPTPSIHGHTSDAHIMVGEHVSEVMAPVPTPSIHGHASDAHIRVGEHVSEVMTLVPTPSIHGHTSDAHIMVGEHVSEVMAPVPTPSIHGHASDAHIRVGEHVSEVTTSVHTPSIHGHASDAHIRVGEHISEVMTLVPTPSIHGHASDSSIKVGGFVSNVAPSHPRWSKHGHSSDSALKVGCVVSGTEPSLSPLPGSAYGHSSDSALGLGCVVSGTEPSLSPLPGSAYGHSSDSALSLACVVSGTEPSLSPLPGSAYGHSSDSALGLGCVVSGTEPSLSPLPGSAYGHSSDSALGLGCVVSGTEPSLSPLPGSAYGHSSDSALGLGCVVSGTEPLPPPHPSSSYGHSSDSALGMGCMVINSRELHPRVETAMLATAGVHGEPERLLEGSSALASIRGGVEQDYLTSLASQYEVEQYQDSYSLMTLAPDSTLLQQVTRGPYGLPVDPSLDRATDTTAVQLSEMVSLPVLMKRSVTTPLITHVSLVNEAVVDYFFVQLCVERHFEALRHFLLMEDGEFAQSLSDLLFEKLGSGQTPGELLTPLVLNSILSKALQYSLHGDSTLAANFTFALRFLPETFHPLAPDALNCLELRYKVDWPLNIIITDTCMNKYNRLFSFLLQLKHMVWTLRDVWFHLKRAALVKGAGSSVQFRQLQLYRHEMQHFVKVIQGYIANQILQVSWIEFTHKLGSANDLDAIHHTHADYLNRAIFRGLLTEKAAPVMNIIHSIFSLILKFRAQLIAHPWSRQQGELVHPSFVALQQSYNTFKYYSHFLFRVVTKLVHRGYQPHLEDFLLRINFNNYYKET
ncbi:hypothetical protein SKAU_G00046470 [Synaphobranchus kaupii]|uniref:Gamma-tubulin complex component 6 n=1 Tax=Synaphobranchus kaupii TaxID=118154 RepID=A0A9Q1G338_SYNKA|nr:hypothetical protein SKAU_G00046470 [Synaphobranchus kaupii]